MARNRSSTPSIASTSPLTSSIDASNAVQDALQRCEELVSRQTDASNRNAAAAVLARYASFDEAARAAFFDGLLARVSAQDARQDLQRGSEPPLRRLFLRLNAAPGGTKWIVRMRGHLHDHQEWTAVDRDLTHVLRLLFHRGALHLQQIDLETPCRLLERLIEAEAVHPINDWREMARRLEADRRCYAFFHPAWPEAPLIFTEVALTRGIASAIGPILDPQSAVIDPRTCDTAMFYSISNCQPGLRGFSFGNWLINGVMARLRAEMPWLRRFATISPIPGFRAWLTASATPPDASPNELLALCAHYLLRAKQGREPADPVARFHLSNGARLQRVNPSSDLSPSGIRRSAGFTVNYVYDPNELERNAETYRRNCEVRAVSEVARLARLAAPLLSTPPLVA